MEQVDEDVEHRAGERLGERMLVAPACEKIEHRQRIGGEPDLAIAGQFGDAVDEIAGVEIAVAGLQQLVDDGIEMQRGDQRGQVGGGFVEAVIFGGGRSWIGHADDGIDDAVPDLMRNHVEVQAERLDAAVLGLMDADLQEAVAHEGVFQKVALNDQFQPVEVAPEMPGDRMAEIFLPHVQREAYRAEQMRGLEFRSFRRDVVEMTVAIGQRGREAVSRPGRHQVERIAAQIFGQAVGKLLADGIDDIHAIVARAGPDSSRRAKTR